MATQTDGPSLADGSFLIQFGFSCLDLLMLDDLWTLGVEGNDSAAVDVGRDMQARIGSLLEGCERVSDLLASQREELNIAWPHLRDRWNISEEDRQALDRFIATYGGLGNLGVATANRLQSILAEEAESLGAKVSALELEFPALADLSWPSKKALALTAVCGLAVPLIVLAGPTLMAVPVGLAIFEGLMLETGIAGAIVAGAHRADPSPPGGKHFQI